MKQWLVDTNVLLDVLGADPTYGERSREAVARCAEAGVLVINPIVLAEVAAFIESAEAIDELLPPTLFRRDPLPWTACFVAGQAFARYRRRGSRQRMLADFLIGAHAAVEGLVLLSRDRGYGRYFRLESLDPTGGS